MAPGWQIAPDKRLYWVIRSGT